MDSNRFSMHVLLHVFLITLAALLFAFFVVTRQQHATAALFAALILLLTWRTFYLFNRTNRMLSGFLDYLRDNDPSLEYTTGFVRRNFGGLEERLQKIIDEVREKRIAEEMHAKYMQMVVDHMEAGILIVNPQGQVETINRKACRYLGAREIKSLSELDVLHDGLGEKILSLKPGSPLLEKIQLEKEVRYLSMKKAQLMLRGMPCEIISLSDIRTELEDQELEAWKKLIRVITHEIMNSITPITTLITAIRRRLSEREIREDRVNIPLKDLRQLLESVDIIEERTYGLTGFIEKYQKLTKIPPLEPIRLEVSSLFERVEFLFREQLEERKIRLITDPGKVRLVRADKDLMEQVLINLIKNAVEALTMSKEPEIRLLSFHDPAGKVIIEVTDNGCGIPEDDLEQVFVPFYTTKKEGSGIGLSFCKQVIRMHKARISVSSRLGEGTSVRLVL